MLDSCLEILWLSKKLLLQLILNEYLEYICNNELHGHIQKLTVNLRTCGNIDSLTVTGWRWLTNPSSCCKSRNLVARSLEAKSLTTQGTTRFWYSASGSCRPSWSRGGKTALPASPYSKAANNCGRILNRPTPSGKLSKCVANWEKNRFFSFFAFTWISSRNKSASTRSFLKKPALLRQRAITSAGFGRLSEFALVSSRKIVKSCLGILKINGKLVWVYLFQICLWRGGTRIQKSIKLYLQIAQIEFKSKFTVSDQ